MERVRWRRDESERHVEPASDFVLGVSRQGADAGDVGGLDCPQHRILEQTRTDPTALRSAVDREPRQKHDRHGMAGQSVGRVLIRPFAHCQRVVADNRLPGTRYVGLGGTCAKVDQGESRKEAVQLLLAAVESGKQRDRA